MSVTVYKEPDYKGIYAVMGPGFYSGKDLVGHHNQSLATEDLGSAINSIRVQPNTIVALYAGYSMTASSGSRVLMGPIDISDLNSIGMSNKIASMLIVPFKSYDSAVPRGGGVTVSDSVALMGRRSQLKRGDYNPARLSSEEVRIAGDRIQSVQADPHTVAILYSGPNFDTTSDAVLVVGPALTEDLQQAGMAGRVSSIRVLYTDPYDIPDRPSSALGTSREYLPGGAWGAYQYGAGGPGGAWGAYRYGAGPGGFGGAYAWGAGPNLGIRPGMSTSNIPRGRGARALVYPDPSSYWSPANSAGSASRDRKWRPREPAPEAVPAMPVVLVAPVPKPAARPIGLKASDRALLVTLIVLFVLVASMAAAALTSSRRLARKIGGRPRLDGPTRQPRPEGVAV